MTVTRKVPLVRRTTSALALLAIAPLALAACTSKSTADAEAIMVTATDSTCDISGNSAETGNTTFSITNNGSKVTEFYVFGAGDRVMGEVENVGPGLTRQLIVNLAEAGTYHTACKPGMVGNGIRSEFVVTGDSVAATDQDGRLTEAADGYKRYVDSQLTALQETVTAFVASIKAGDVAAAKAQYPLTRTYYERIEPIAESFPDDLDPRIDLREVDVEPGWNWTGFHRLGRTCGSRGCSPTPTRSPTNSSPTSRSSPTVSRLPTSSSTRSRWPAAPRHCSTRSPAPRSPARRTSSRTPTCTTSGQRRRFAGRDRVAASDPRRPQPELAARIDQRFADLDAELAQFRQGDGFVSYETVTEPQRQALSQKIDALSAEVSQVQGVVAGQ